MSPLRVTSMSRVVREPRVISERAGGEVVILDPETRACHVTSGWGAHVWDATERPGTVRDVCARVASAVGESRGAVFDRVVAFLEELHGLGLVRLSSPE